MGLFEWERKAKSNKDQQGTENSSRNNELTSNTILLNSYLLIITLNRNGGNALIKRHSVSDWVKKQDPLISSLEEIHLRLKVTAD